MELALRPFVPTDTEAVVALWQRCGLVRSNNDSRQDIARKRRVRPDLFIVGEHAGAIVAVLMIGCEGHRGWINWLGVDPAFRRCGWAAA